jgi:hypothetical protein
MKLFLLFLSSLSGIRALSQLRNIFIDIGSYDGSSIFNFFDTFESPEYTRIRGPPTNQHSGVSGGVGSGLSHRKNGSVIPFLLFF